MEFSAVRREIKQTHGHERAARDVPVNVCLDCDRVIAARLVILNALSASALSLAVYKSENYAWWDEQALALVSSQSTETE